MAEGMGFEPTIGFNPYNGLANRRLQPLGHPSAGVLKSHDVCRALLAVPFPPGKPGAPAVQESATSKPRRVAGRDIMRSYQAPTWG